MNAAVAWLCATRWRQALLLLAIGAAVFLPKLGSTGLSMSEGHRAIPAWEMLDDARADEAHWLVPRMFETAYLRKPPGMLWAIAASTTVFGETEFAARFPGALAATLLGLAVWWFATRWFGSPWGVAAGLAQILLPVTWPSARSAEIEPLHMLTTGVACLLVVDWFARTPRARSGRWTRAGVLSISVLAMLMVKGPSGAPFLGGTLVGSLIVLGLGQRSRRDMAKNMLLPLLLAIGAAALVAQLLTQPDLGTEPAVRQGVDSFLWERGKLLQILFISPTILATMLPVSLALLFPWGPDAARERRAERAPTGPGTVARALAFSCLGALVIFEVAGVSNERYGLPLCALLTPLVAYVARGAGHSGSRPLAPAFLSTRPAIARAMFLGSPLAWPILLLIGAAVYVGVLERDRRASSGREAGIALAAHLPDGTQIWADEIIEARPEVLYYAVREAAAQGKSVRVRWLKPGFLPEKQPEGLLLLLREDDLADEVAAYREMDRFGTLREIARGGVHKYTFVLVETGH
ncbi:MAG: glycosyltransferase family 39 protein [Planctomycetota bacterium]|nr:glycosyltransferase family 39 protein [Planctomycetota bacterium]